MMTCLSYKLYSAGYCTHIECMVLRGGSWKSKKFPALCCLIHHPDHGYILYDTGYSQRFHQATKAWPFCLYKKVTPVYLEERESLVQQLAADGIRAEDIRTVIVSHFHADHIGGLQDFPQAEVLCLKEAYDDIRDQKGIRALIKGYLPPLMPDDFKDRTTFIESRPRLNLDQTYAPFQWAYDLLGNGQLLGIPLPGHASGQLGLLFKAPNQKSVFLIADSCWSSKAFQHHILPNPLTALIHHNWQAYKQTLVQIHQLSQSNKNIIIIPSHCSDIDLMEASCWIKP